MRRFSLAAALVLMAGFTAVAQNPSPPADEHQKLPPGEGRDLVIRVCSSCHDPEVVVNEQLDESNWKKLVDEMAGKGADATDAELDEIVHYLARAFPPSK